MKAIKVTVDYGEWSKVSDFLRELDGEDLFSYQIDNVSFVIVAIGEYSMSWAKAMLTKTFNEEVIIISFIFLSFIYRRRRKREMPQRTIPLPYT